MPATPRRILLVRLSAIGDVVRTLPALEALRRTDPEAHIAWLVEDRAQAAVRDHPALDTLYVFERKALGVMLRRPWQWPKLLRHVLSFVADLRRRPYDIVIDFQSLLKSGVLTWVTGAPLRLGYTWPHCREPLNTLFTNAHMDPGDPRLPRVERNLISVAHFAPPECWRMQATWPESADAAAWAMGILESLDGQVPILLHPGTSRSEKWWYASGWGAVADALHEQTGRPILFTWGPGERAATEEAVGYMRGEGALAPATQSLHHLQALIRRAACFITTDNGPMHMAALTDTPVVGLFGPVDVQVNQPGTSRMRCVTAAGVFGPGDAFPEDGGSMTDIRTTDVIRAALDIIEPA